MKRILLLSLLTVTAFDCVAQPPPVPNHATSEAIRTITDPSMVVQQDDMQLEVLPTKRASPAGKASVRIVGSSKSDSIGPGKLGVLYNHALQTEGYISGEVAFKMRDDLQVDASFDAAVYPGLAKLTNPNIYVVHARTPAEFVEVTQILQSRDDVEWVEPIVEYSLKAPSDR